VTHLNFLILLNFLNQEMGCASMNRSKKEIIKKSGETMPAAYQMFESTSVLALTLSKYKNF
jgi:hypothetical protein